MIKYHKINSVFKRDDKGNFTSEFSTPEFEYLFNNEWIGTEKVDGTNIRIHWNGEEATFGGRTDRAMIPPHLSKRLNEIIRDTNFEEIFEEADDVTLFGEGYGYKIQKVGSLYLPDSVDFILFDVKIGEWWMRRDFVNVLAEQMNIKAVKVLFEGTLAEAVESVKEPFQSSLGIVQAEGLVLTPKVDLFARSGDRVITKLKTKDFTKK